MLTKQTTPSHHAHTFTLQVKGDSSDDGNIELSIKMPSGNGGTGHDDFVAATDNVNSTTTGSRHWPSVSSQRQKQQANGYPSSVDGVPGRRIGSSSSNGSTLNHTTNNGRLNAKLATGPKTARDLSNLIDLMPPLSIEQGTKRLILAKKLDRENLDKYMGSYQSSINSLSQSSSASLTVHIKCQLRDKIRMLNRTVTVGTTNSSAVTDVSTRKITSRKSSTILIPIHLIVTDENDNWPSFVGWPYIIDLNETAQVGSLLQGNEIVAVDNDQQGPLSTIEYSIVAGSFWSDSFGFLNPLDSRSLIVKDNRLFDYETQSKITLR